MILNPVRIASLHQANIITLVGKLRADASCIGQLLIGRTVRRREDGGEFVVKEARLGSSYMVSLYGYRADRAKSRQRKAVRIGLVAHIELVEPQP